MKSAIGSLAALVALSAPALVRATPTASALSNVTVTGFNSVSFDIDGDGTNDFTLVANDGNAEAEFSAVANSDNFVANAFYLEGDFISNTAADRSPFILQDDSTNYVGFNFVSGGNTYTGWALVQVDSEALTATLLSAGWESDPDTGIVAGAPSAIPEPATTALAAGGLAAFLALAARRRKSRA